MTLTTNEELEFLASSSNANELTRRLARECLANREAQPVGYAENGKGFIYPPERQDRIKNPVAVYTAPPANANANAVAWEMRYWSDGYNMWGDWERITAEQHAEMSVKFATDNDYEFRVLYDAPPAPQSTNAADWGINMQTGTPILVYKNCSVIESEQAHYVLSLINSVAMLAQPVSSGYKLVPAEATEDMIAAAMNCDDVSFNADETFCVNFGNIYAAMLAAAPEGGSDHDTRR
ncbi:hypothetical protein [Serratia marcescens]|uniref:hypothetical protein n=1 Tax=Serratia marcescens TaxID=615 RepID=UPI0007453AEE|nr:hypothetical protein [Serratia marcescens]EME1467130.1 hypothetical protein [Serratia marcescens]MBN3902797.1 hypothetical protein [Serratia marcescens]MBN3912147.1 hypothetical protein [Serratia marcescens]MBN3916955.1 hypothetical protein [Serratia marcescens]MBN3935432.1 hypothetical protein [Serratia marcescens]